MTKTRVPTTPASPSSGCSFAPISGASCDDGNACTDEDTCVAGSCVGESVVCDDNNPCTIDFCDPLMGCDTSIPTSVTACDDGDVCTENDVCQAGNCVPGVPITCDDGNECTTDTCDAVEGCQFVANTNPCEDGNACTTGDTCDQGACVPGGPTDCDDENDCTADSCVPSIGCVGTTLEGAACDDGDACTSGDTHLLRRWRICESTTPVSCDDGNPCTDDSCDPTSGCVNAPNTEACDDGSDCTEGDSCIEEGL